MPGRVLQRGRGGGGEDGGGGGDGGGAQVEELGEEGEGRCGEGGERRCGEGREGEGGGVSGHGESGGVSEVLGSVVPEEVRVDGVGGVVEAARSF